MVKKRTVAAERFVTENPRSVSSSSSPFLGLHLKLLDLSPKIVLQWIDEENRVVCCFRTLIAQHKSLDSISGWNPIRFSLLIRLITIKHSWKDFWVESDFSCS